MRWTKDTPTQPGWYWLKRPSQLTQVVLIEQIAELPIRFQIYFNGEATPLAFHNYSLRDAEWWRIMPPGRDTLPSHKLASKIMIPGDIAARDPKYKEFATADLKVSLLRKLVESLTMGRCYLFCMRIAEAESDQPVYGTHSFELRCDIDVMPAEFEAIESNAEEVNG